jgi:hypothetical protein
LLAAEYFRKLHWETCPGKIAIGINIDFNIRYFFDINNAPGRGHDDVAIDELYILTIARAICEPPDTIVGNVSLLRCHEKGFRDAFDRLLPIDVPLDSEDADDISDRRERDRGV